MYKAKPWMHTMNNHVLKSQEVVFCRFGPSSINEPNQNGPYVSLSHVIGPDVTEIPFRPNKSYSWARIPAAGRLSQAVAASFSTPAPPEAEHRGVAAAAAAAALQMRGGGEGEADHIGDGAHGGGRRRSAQCEPRGHSPDFSWSPIPSPSPTWAARVWQRRWQSDYHYNQTKPMLLLLLRQAASEQVEVLPAPDHLVFGDFLAQSLGRRPQAASIWWYLWVSMLPVYP
ncbi:hypothetical protein [Oryza sativa Japonica Group]|uniref:Uncharacterized protein n=1 Tax=Oryza sativa subsp. japonica TaxID=39947 RepID=Q657F4_ORYSJ|nr:hypothetical protein [Oryza sativa Japonica Group]